MPPARPLPQLLGRPIEGGAIVGIRDLDVPVNLGLVRSEGRGFAWLPGDRPPPAGTEDHAYIRFTSDWWAWHGGDSL